MLMAFKHVYKTNYEGDNNKIKMLSEAIRKNAEVLSHDINRVNPVNYPKPSVSDSYNGDLRFETTTGFLRLNEIYSGSGHTSTELQYVYDDRTNSYTIKTKYPINDWFCFLIGYNGDFIVGKEYTYRFFVTIDDTKEHLLDDPSKYFGIYFSDAYGSFLTSEKIVDQEYGNSYRGKQGVYQSFYRDRNKETYFFECTFVAMAPAMYMTIRTTASELANASFLSEDDLLYYNDSGNHWFITVSNFSAVNGYNDQTEQLHSLSIFGMTEQWFKARNQGGDIISDYCEPDHNVGLDGDIYFQLTDSERCQLNIDDIVTYSSVGSRTYINDEVTWEYNNDLVINDNSASFSFSGMNKNTAHATYSENNIYSPRNIDISDYEFYMDAIQNYAEMHISGFEKDVVYRLEFDMTIVANNATLWDDFAFISRTWPDLTYEEQMIIYNREMDTESVMLCLSQDDYNSEDPIYRRLPRHYYDYDLTTTRLQRFAIGENHVVFTIYGTSYDNNTLLFDFSAFSQNENITFNITNFKITRHALQKMFCKINGYWSEVTLSGGGGGTDDYEELSNKPSINNVELIGNNTSSDLGVVITLTQSEYDALSSEEKNDPNKVYYITDGSGSSSAFVTVIGNPDHSTTEDLRKIQIGTEYYAIPDGVYVEANPEDIASEDLSKLQVGDGVYNIPKGSSVTANPSGSASENLNKLEIDGDIFDIPSGTTVIANPQGTASEDLTKIKIGNSIYSIPSGGGSAGIVEIVGGISSMPQYDSLFNEVVSYQLQ